MTFVWARAPREREVEFVAGATKAAFGRPDTVELLFAPAIVYLLVPMSQSRDLRHAHTGY